MNFQLTFWLKEAEKSILTQPIFFFAILTSFGLVYTQSRRDISANKKSLDLRLQIETVVLWYYAKTNYITVDRTSHWMRCHVSATVLSICWNLALYANPLCRLPDFHSETIYVAICMSIDHRLYTESKFPRKRPNDYPNRCTKSL
jgi:hypothetical protein